MDVSRQTFQYSGSKYTFSAALRSPDGLAGFALDPASVEEFEYQTEFNSLVMVGSITYLDSYGKLGQFTERHGSICTVQFMKNDQKSDGGLTIEPYSAVERFRQEFLVQNMLVLQRDGDSIKYKIELASVNAIDCTANLEYSNYDKEPQPVFNVLRECLVAAKLPVDMEKFDAVKSDMRLNYTTNGNDNAKTVAKYLLGRQFYYAEREQSLKFLYYDHLAGVISLFDAMNPQTFSGGFPLVLSFIKSNVEQMAGVEENKLGSVTKFPAEEFVRSSFGVRLYDYDIESNSMRESYVKPDEIQGYFNAVCDFQTGVRQKLTSAAGEREDFIRRAAYWNNDLDVYGDMVKCLTKDNALVIESVGEISRRPGAHVVVKVDIDQKNLATESTEEYNDLQQRYRELAGDWFSSRVHGFVCPNKNGGSFRQLFTLVRNFVPDYQDSQQSSPPKS